MADYNGLEYREDFTCCDYHEYNKANGYGLTKSQLRQWTMRHISGTPSQKKWIEDMLTDMNFHYESGLLHRGKYEKVLEKL